MDLRLAVAVLPLMALASWLAAPGDDAPEAPAAEPPDAKQESAECRRPPAALQMERSWEGMLSPSALELFQEQLRRLLERLEALERQMERPAEEVEVPPPPEERPKAARSSVGSAHASAGDAESATARASSSGEGLSLALSYADGEYQIEVSYPTADGPRRSRVRGSRAAVEEWLAEQPPAVQQAVRRQLSAMDPHAPLGRPRLSPPRW